MWLSFRNILISKLFIDISRLNAQGTRIDSKDQDEDEYPSHFKAGSLIQLSSGVLRPVEDLNTDDFIKSAELSNEVQIDQSVVVSITPSKNEGYVMLGFSVGKEDVQVSQKSTIIRILSKILCNEESKQIVLVLRNLKY